MHWFQGAFWSWETVPTMEHWNQFWDASWMYGIYCIYWLSWPRFIEQISSNHAIHPVKEAVSIYHKSQETDPGNCILFDKEKYTTLRLFFFFQWKVPLYIILRCEVFNFTFKCVLRWKKEKYFYIRWSSERYLSAPKSRILELQSFENQFLK